MAYHINNTNQPVRIKTWTLKSRQISKDSILFLTSLGITVRCHSGSVPLYHQGRTYQFAGDSRIEIETTSTEQETMLQLKFDTDLVLLMDEYVLPNSMSLCTLNTMVF